MIERMKQLPAELRMVTGDLRAETLRCLAGGDYSRAIILLFGHQLLMLDKAGSLRLTRGKTNGRYVRETRANNPPAAAHFTSTVDAFERCYFGKHPITRAEMEELWKSNLKLEAILDPRREAVA